MHNSTLNFENPRAPRPLRPSDLPTGVPWTRTEAGQRESIRLEGMKIALTAVQSIGMDTRDPWGAPKRLPDYALAVSLLFTKATNQTIILGTPPKHVLSTSILWSSLAHDKRFEQVPMNEAAPGDIVIGSGWQHGADGYAGIVVDHAGGPLTDAQRKLLEQKNAEAVAIIARLGDKGEKPDTPESILNGPLKSTWGSNLGWMPGTPKWDLRQQYKGYSDQDIALMEAARRNGVRAAVLLAQAGQLPKSQVTALQLRGVGVLADATLNLGLALAPYDSIAALGSRALLGSAEGTVGAEAGELASRSGQVSDKPISTASSPDFGAVKWVPEPSTAMKEGPAAYQDGAPASRYGMAPQLSATDSSGTITAKFDGVDATTGEMVDRKTNVANSTKFADEALRQSVTAAKNGFGVRWEVPNATVQARAQRILSTNGIKNIRVVVAPRK